MYLKLIIIQAFSAQIDNKMYKNYFTDYNISLFLRKIYFLYICLPDCPMKRGSCNEESVKGEIKNEMDIDNDYRDYPPNVSIKLSLHKFHNVLVCLDIEL